MSYYYEREEELENLLNKGALWAVTYGDLMSYLMIFFLIMFSIVLNGKGSQNLAAIQSHFGGKTNTEAMKKIQQKGKETVVADELQKNFNVKVTEEKIQITLDEKVLFDSGSADLKPQVRQALEKFAMLASGLNNQILIEGHTDNVPVRRGKYSSNFELSMARAYSMLRHLVDAQGIDPKRLSAAGYGEYHPIAPNDTLANRALNRRIEINLIRTK